MKLLRVYLRSQLCLKCDRIIAKHIGKCVCIHACIYDIKKPQTLFLLPVKLMHGQIWTTTGANAYNSHVNFVFLPSDNKLTSNSNSHHLQNAIILHYPGDWKYILEFRMPPPLTSFFKYLFLFNLRNLKWSCPHVLWEDQLLHWWHIEFTVYTLQHAPKRFLNLMLFHT